MRYINLSAAIIVLTMLNACSATGNAVRAPAANTSLPYTIDTKTRATYKRAVALVKSGKNAQAEKILKSLVKSKPELAGPFANLSIVYLRQNRPEQAASMISRAIENNPGNPEYHNLKGIISRQRGSFRDAEASYLRAINIKPDVADYHMNLGILYDLYLFEHKKAVSEYKKYQELRGKEDKKVAGWIIDLGRRIQ